MPGTRHQRLAQDVAPQFLWLHKPEVLFTLNIHGNEYLSIGGYWFVDWLMRHAFHPDYDCPERDWLRWLIDNREIYLVPSLNPDGYDENHRGDNSGADLNRDFDHSQPNPWDAIDHAWNSLKIGGYYCSYSPLISQVENTVKELKKQNFIEIKTIENIQRELIISDFGTRPSFDMLGHTGYLTFARKVIY